MSVQITRYTDPCLAREIARLAEAQQEVTVRLLGTDRIVGVARGEDSEL